MKRVWLVLLALSLGTVLEVQSAEARTTRVKKSRSLSSVCRTTRSFAKGEIWKPRASSHIPTSDPRRKSTSFIVLRGYAAPSASCLNVYDSEGTLIHKLGVYSRNGTYKARFYGGSGCGDKKSASTVNSTARRNTGSSTIYVKVGTNTCVSLPSATSCKNSSNC
jgi:hypothetical protein